MDPHSMAANVILKSNADLIDLVSSATSKPLTEDTDKIDESDPKDVEKKNAGDAYELGESIWTGKLDNEKIVERVSVDNQVASDSDEDD